MFKMVFKGRPRPAERPRARFSGDHKTYYLYTPPTYEAYKEKLINFFDTFSNEPKLKELFDKNNAAYGLSIKIIFRLKGKGNSPFYGRRPDIDNLYKAVTDSLFESRVNQIDDGFLTDVNGNLLLDEEGNEIVKTKQIIDDSRVVHSEQLKLRVNDEADESITIVIRDMGADDFD